MIKGSDPKARLSFWRHRRAHPALESIVLIIAGALSLRIGTWLVAS